MLPSLWRRRQAVKLRREPLRIVSEHLGWQGHSPEEIQAMKDAIVGKEPIDD